MVAKLQSQNFTDLHVLFLIVKVTNLDPPLAAAELIVGGVASITMASELEREPAPPAEGKVVMMLLPSASLIVPLFRAKGAVAW